MRLTIQSAKVLAKFLYQSSSEGLYGLSLCDALDLKSGTLYPILARFVEAGWIEGRKEDIDPRVEGRPQRTYYVLTEKGAIEGRKAFEEANPWQLAAVKAEPDLGKEPTNGGQKKSVLGKLGAVTAVI